MLNIGNMETEVLRCELCNINYKSRTGLWKHNKNYHTKILVETEIIPQNYIM
jgi:hypothetical protein